MPLPYNLQHLLRKAQTAHREIYNAIGTLKQGVSAESSCEDLADTVLAAREAETALNDIRKEVTKFKELCERLACNNYLQDASRVMVGEPIRTENVTATPDMKVCASIPNFEKSPVEYAEMMTYLGIDPCLWDTGVYLTEDGEQYTEVVRVHWPGMMSLLTRLKRAGLPLPNGINVDKTYSQFSLRCVKKGTLLSATDNVEKPLPVDESPF